MNASLRSEFRPAWQFTRWVVVSFSLVSTSCLLHEGGHAFKPAGAVGLELPDVTGLASQAAHARESKARTGEPTMRLSVLVDAKGVPCVEGRDKVSPWCGVNLPHDHKCQPRKAVRETVIKLRLDNTGGDEKKVRVEADGKLIKDMLSLAVAVKEGSPDCLLVDAAPDVPWGHVIRAVTIAVESGVPLSFRTPDSARPAASKEPDRALCKRLAEEAGKLNGPDGLSALGVHIRADARASWAGVEGVLLACMEAKVWRVSFAAVSGDKEVIVGREGDWNTPPVILKPDVFPPDQRSATMQE